MSTSAPFPTPFTAAQQVAQEIESEAITIAEDIEQADPPPITVTWEQKNKLAGELWLANGGVQDDPLTMEHWLLAESELLAETPE